MDSESFNKYYLGEFKPDPRIDEAVKFLRSATREKISQARREGWFDKDVYREAKRILNQEDK